MILISILLSGIGGTALMTAFINILAYLTKKPIRVVRILGTMATNGTTPYKGLSEKLKSRIVGISLHYLIGIIWAALFVILWHYHVGKPNLYYSLIFGFVCGVLAMLGWRFHFYVHSNPPAIPLRAFLLALLCGHVVFGIGMMEAYNLLN